MIKKRATRGEGQLKKKPLKRVIGSILYLTEEEAWSFDAASQHQMTRKISRNEFAKQRLFATSVLGDYLPKSKVGVDAKFIIDRLDQVIKLLNQFVIQVRTIGQNYNQSVKRLNWTCNKTLDKFLSNILQLPIIIVKRGKIA